MSTYKILIVSLIIAFFLWLLPAIFNTNTDQDLKSEITFPQEQRDIVDSDKEFSAIDAQQQKPKTIWSMKNVPVTTSYQDLQKLKDGGINVVTTEWGLGSDPVSVEKFLQTTYEIGLEVVMDGGFSPASWGYDQFYDGGMQEPQWQSEKVKNWINTIKKYPHIYAYDISNEFGENLPVPAKDITDDVSWREKYAITKQQLRIVRDDIKEVDSQKPLLLRLRQWDSGSEVFILDEHFEKDLVEIVMLNLYTNWVWNGYNPDEDQMIQEKAQIYIDAIREIDPDVEIWISLAAFDDQPYFRKPSPENLQRDVENTKKLDNIQGIAFFGLGYENSSSWYLFENGIDLWEEITQLIQSET